MLFFIFCSYRWLRVVGCSMQCSSLSTRWQRVCICPGHCRQRGCSRHNTSPAPVHIYYLLSTAGLRYISTIYFYYLLSTAPVHDDVLTRVRVTTSLSRLQQLQCCTEASEAPSLPPAPVWCSLRAGPVRDGRLKWDGRQQTGESVKCIVWENYNKHRWVGPI